MTPEAELLLMNASRAQLVREQIRPALARGEIIICDRFYDSTTAYQGYGRQLDLETVRRIIEVAVGNTRPELTLLLQVSAEIRHGTATIPPGYPALCARPLGGANREFFERVGQRLSSHRQRKNQNGSTRLRPPGQRKTCSRQSGGSCSP